MLKFGFIPAALGVAALAVPVAANAVILGPAAATCASGERGVLVTVAGLKQRSGKVRVQLYAAKSNFLDKGVWLERVDVAVPASGNVDVCVPVETAGNYVVSVRHDLNGNGKSDRKDGGGFSGNPDVKLGDLIAKRKPSLSATTFRVGNSTAKIRVVLNYVQGLSFEPIG
ncbi:MAG: DUF2141 domain-containing protein [Sphingomonadales bacterium]|nr:DUF2141 domain-containing protein [Sphingomonadales bacterium]